jgi:HK97 family phage major capsid protein
MIAATNHDFADLSSFGVDRGNPLGVTADAPPGSYRHYAASMLRNPKVGFAPTLADSIAGAFGLRTCFDDRKRSVLANRLELIGTVNRTGSGIQGSGGGFAVAPGIAADIWDQARMIDGPWLRCNWERVEHREEWFPVSGEAQLAIGSQGLVSTWGYGETVFPAAVDDKIDRVRLVQNRLLMQTIISRDVAVDATRVLRWLKYRGYRAIRLAIEAAMMFGSGTSGNGFPCPTGVLASPSTISVKRGTGGTIVAADLDTMHSKIYAGCLRNCVWHMGSDSLKVIDQLAVSGQYPELLYARPGQATGSVFATLKGHPVIVLETSPAVGSVGDVCLVDWSQYVLSYLRLNPMDSPLAFDFAPPSDGYHQGMVGMPDEALEARVSNQALFTNDELVINFKFRGDGGFLWPGVKTTQAGLTVGPAVQLV